MDLNINILKEMITEELNELNESWLPSEFKEDIPKGLSLAIVKKLNNAPELIFALCVSLLEEINEHQLAKKINTIFDKELE